ncbi:MAG: helix-turn-helix transcriptional regulator [Marmoricola sp.]
MRPERLADELTGLAREGLTWPDFVAAADAQLSRVVDFDRSCWHTVDPGTVLLTGSVNREIECSGSWLAEHEYVLEDVNKWGFLARSGRLAGSTSEATHGDRSRSARFRSHASIGIADELRASFVDGDGYWAAVGLLRNSGRPAFDSKDVELLVRLSSILAAGAKRSLISAMQTDVVSEHVGPGVITFDAAGGVESLTPAAEHWVRLLVEDPAPEVAAESKIVQAVAARARMTASTDPLQASARARVRAIDGTWLLLYASTLSGTGARTAVVIQQASPAEIAPLVALAYGLTPREAEVTRLCLKGLATKEIAATLHLSAYTVQDHLKSIFEKTSVRSRGELVGQVFLEHYVPRWERLSDAPDGWCGYASNLDPQEN